jgi:hypothetical protein
LVGSEVNFGIVEPDVGLTRCGLSVDVHGTNVIVLAVVFGVKIGNHAFDWFWIVVRELDNSCSWFL